MDSKLDASSVQSLASSGYRLGISGRLGLLVKGRGAPGSEAAAQLGCGFVPVFLVLWFSLQNRATFENVSPLSTLTNKL